MKIKNKENFVKWLYNTCKNSIIVDTNYIELILEELKKKYEETGNTIFELSRLETKSGHAEIYSYIVEFEEKDGEIETTYIF